MESAPAILRTLGAAPAERSPDELRIAGKAPKETTDLSQSICPLASFQRSLRTLKVAEAPYRTVERRARFVMLPRLSRRWLFSA